MCYRKKKHLVWQNNLVMEHLYSFLYQYIAISNMLRLYIQWSAIIMGSILHDNAYIPTLTKAEHWSRLALTNDTPYFALVGELWGVYCKYCGDNWPCYNATTLYWCSADSTFAPSQWETVLLCNNVSHWLGANLESVLLILKIWMYSFGNNF